MNLMGALSDARTMISGGISGLEEQIRRLQEANSKIAEEQNQGMNEIRLIQLPELANDWIGPRAQGFDESRDAAYKDMEKVFTQDYDEYQSKISIKISQLQTQLAALQAASALASAIGESIEAIDETLDNAEETIASIGNEIKGLTNKFFS